LSLLIVPVIEINKTPGISVSAWHQNSTMTPCIEYLTDRIFNNSLNITCLHDTAGTYVTLKSDKTSFIGTHCDTICWE